MSNGVYPNLSNADYHASAGISKTKLDMFARDQSSLEWAQNCPVDEDKLDALNFGSAMHTMLLEPHLYDKEFAVMPEINGRTNDGKAERKAFEEENKHKKILTTEEHKKLQLMFGSVMAHPFARYLIEADGAAESSYYWNDPETGILCKCRPDKNISNSRFLVDVKTTDTLANFERYSIEDYRYHVQAPFYIDGVNACGEEKDTFIFLVIQKTIELGRYPVRCVTLPAQAVEHGRYEYKANLEAFKRASESGYFNGLYQAELSYNFIKKMEG
jgi:exodeoxyribonuclease VIII